MDTPRCPHCPYAPGRPAPETPEAVLGRRLRNLRLALTMTHVQFARRIGIPAETLAAIETGTSRAHPDLIDALYFGTVDEQESARTRILAAGW